MSRISIPLKTDEREALQVLAERERRDPRDQAALIVCRELERTGDLPPAAPSPVEHFSAKVPADVSAA